MHRDHVWSTSLSEQKCSTPSWCCNIRISALSAIPHVQAESFKTAFVFDDCALHGITYAWLQESGQVGDEFMKQIQPVAAYVPYMTCPGNHEEA
jgi:hypothetical protein